MFDPIQLVFSIITLFAVFVAAKIPLAYANRKRIIDILDDIWEICDHMESQLNSGEKPDGRPESKQISILRIKLKREIKYWENTGHYIGQIESNKSLESMLREVETSVNNTQSFLTDTYRHRAEPVTRDMKFNYKSFLKIWEWR